MPFGATVDARIGLTGAPAGVGVFAFVHRSVLSVGSLGWCTSWVVSSDGCGDRKAWLVLHSWLFVGVFGAVYLLRLLQHALHISCAS